VLYVENDRVENSERLIRLIQGLGYRLWWHFPRYFNPDNFAGNPENVFGSGASINMLGVPSEFAANITGMREVGGPSDRP